MRPPSAEAAPERRRILGLHLALAAVWSLAAWRVPLFPDEMYYWEWSRRLATGYFDHPPAIGWLIRAGTFVLGDSPLGVRVLPIACGLLTVAAVGAMAARLAGPSAARRAVMLVAVLPIMTGAFVLATPDAPLLATTSWALYAVLRAADPDEPPSGALRWWLVSGLLLGLAGLSKYIAILVPLALGGAFLVHRPLRRTLATPGPWAGAALAGLVVSPVVAWNAAHGWASFRFQLAHGLGVSAGGTVLGREVELVAGQLLVATPILLGFVVAATRRGLKGREGALGVAVAAVPATVALAFVLSATRRRVEANWLAAAYPAAVALLAAWPLGRRGRAWLRAGGILAVALSAVLVAHLATSLVPLPEEPGSLSQAFGRAAVAAAVERTALDEGGPRLHFAGNRYQDAASLAFLLPEHPRVFSLNVRSRPNQYDLWPKFPEVACPGDDLLLVLDGVGEGGGAALDSLRPHFGEVEAGERVERRAPATGGPGEVVGQSRIWLLSGWKGSWLAGERGSPAGSLSRGRPGGARCRS